MIQSQPRWRRFRRALAGTGIAVLALGLAACASSGEPPEGVDGAGVVADPGAIPLPTEVIPEQELNDEIHALVPQAFLDAGAVRVATSADYPPNEFVSSTGDVVGIHADMGKALGEIIGVDFEFTVTSFDGIIPGLQADRYEIGMSSAAVTNERKEIVDFVSDILGANALMVRADFEADSADLDLICGLTVGVGKGTIEAERATTQSEKCVEEGKDAATIQTYPSQVEAVLALTSSRVDAIWAAGLALSYIEKGNPGVIKVIGRDLFVPGTNGIMLTKDNGLAEPVQRALQQMIDDGTYTAILDKWGAGAYGVDKAEINPETPY